MAKHLKNTQGQLKIKEKKFKALKVLKSDVQHLTIKDVVSGNQLSGEDRNEIEKKRKEED